jgi:hypothetical protein
MQGEGERWRVPTKGAGEHGANVAAAAPCLSLRKIHAIARPGPPRPRPRRAMTRDVGWPPVPHASFVEARKTVRKNLRTFRAFVFPRTACYVGRYFRAGL